MSYFPFPLNLCPFPVYLKDIFNSPELDYRAIFVTGFVILQSQPTMDSLNQSLFPVLFKISQHYLFPFNPHCIIPQSKGKLLSSSQRPVMLQKCNLSEEYILMRKCCKLYLSLTNPFSISVLGLTN